MSSEQISQLLRGSIAVILESTGDWHRIRAEDGYEGWMHAGYLSQVSAAQTCLSAAALSLGCTVRTHGGEVQLPFGAHVFRGEVAARGDTVGVRDLADRFPRSAIAVATTAVEYFRGTPYQWGGVSPWGADCSGFTQLVLRVHSLTIPRDSAEQSQSGSESTSTPEQNTIGDLLFFSDRDDKRITHVGIALGGSRMVHVALGRGGFAIEDFGSNLQDPYTGALATRFQLSRRIV